MPASTENIESYDVVILGGGPAGAATALSLRSHAPDLSVALIEQTNYHAMRIGETLPPRCGAARKDWSLASVSR